MILFMVVPVVWMLAWILLRLILVERLRARRRGTVIEGTWKDLDEPPPTPAAGINEPLCGQKTLHVLLRAFGAEESCRRCAAEAEARREREQRAAVEEAERQISRRDRS